MCILFARRTRNISRGKDERRIRLVEWVSCKGVGDWKEGRRCRGHLRHSAAFGCGVYQDSQLFGWNEVVLTSRLI